MDNGFVLVVLSIGLAAMFFLVAHAIDCWHDIQLKKLDKKFDGSKDN